MVKSEQKFVSKREEMRMRRRRRLLLTRLIVLGVLIAVIAAIAIFVVIPSINLARQTRFAQQTAIAAPVTVPPLVERQLVDGKTLGNPNATVKIDIFEDFQCPNCKNYSENVEPQIVEQYVNTGLVYYEFHHMPFMDDFSGSGESDQPANASMCAAEQGMFWEYHDIVYANWNGENQGAFLDPRLVTFAEKIGLDMEQFNECFERNAYEDVIASDLAQGSSLQVTSVPTIMVNGQRVDATFEAIQAAIEAELGQQ